MTRFHSCTVGMKKFSTDRSWVISSVLLTSGRPSSPRCWMTSVTTLTLVFASVLTLSTTPLSRAVCDSATPVPIEPRTWPKVGATAFSWPLTSAASAPVLRPTGVLASASAPAIVTDGVSSGVDSTCSTAAERPLARRSGETSVVGRGLVAVDRRPLRGAGGVFVAKCFTLPSVSSAGGFADACGSDGPRTPGDQRVRLRPGGDVHAGDRHHIGARARVREVDDLHGVRAIGSSARTRWVVAGDAFPAGQVHHEIDVIHEPLARRVVPNERNSQHSRFVEFERPPPAAPGRGAAAGVAEHQEPVVVANGEAARDGDPPEPGDRSHLVALAVARAHRGRTGDGDRLQRGSLRRPAVAVL